MTQPVVIPAGHELLAPDFDPYEAMTGAWAAYTPVWSSGTTQPVLNNGTLTGRFFQAGKLVFVRISLLMGSTTTFGTGLYFLSLPVAPQLNGLLGAYAIDASASARYAGQAWLRATTTGGDNMRISLTSGPGGATETVPFTWANGDQLILAGSYETL